MIDRPPAFAVDGAQRQNNGTPSLC
jgi:hypothetical protein